jgi:hypothetical protein
MIRKLSLVVALIAATCFAGLVFSGSSAINDTASAMTLGQNNNRDNNRDMGRRHNRGRHNRRWHRRHGRRHNRRGNGNANRM